MTMPRHFELFDSVLAALADGAAHHRVELAEAVLASWPLTDEERAQTMRRGGNRAFSRVHWAIEYLAQAGAVARPSRGFVQITDSGRELVSSSRDGVTLEVLRATPGMKAWRERTIAARAARREEGETEHSGDEEFDESDGLPPVEQINESVSLLHAALRGDLLARIQSEKPEFLEKLVLQLLHAMGYGATSGSLEHLGGPGDEGVDGVIHQDQLGIDRIYVQAKRYRDSGPIGRPTIQSFVGALSGKKATRGVFITTSRFSADARDYVAGLTGFTVVLIDGESLTSLMLEHGVGVVPIQEWKVLGLDENFFSGDGL